MSQQSVAQHFNIADRLRESAAKYPFSKAVIFPDSRDAADRVLYSHLTFEQLDQESDRLARGLIQMGVKPGTRLVLMVRPSLEFIALTFALFKAGAVIVLIDPGMGQTNIFNCLEEVEPEGFVAIPIVQWIRRVNARKFPKANFNVTVGSGVHGKPTYQQLLGGKWASFEFPQTKATDDAAIIFTSGSTGPPKGVLYEHGMFNAQVDQLREFYDIQPGEVDLPGFPLFALFNSAMGVTTVIPDMDPTKPAQVNPLRIIEAIRDQGVTQAFGSPALWNRVGRHCEEQNIQFPSLRRVLSAGAPVPPHVIERMTKTFVRAEENSAVDIHTPYGATESLPVCSISGQEVLSSTIQKTREGAGTCIGRPFSKMTVRVIEISEGPISHFRDARQLPAGEIGEIVVKGPVVTREYLARPDATAAAKIPDDDGFWHRMGDVGYLDNDGLLWFCGRKAHIVDTVNSRMFTIPCESIFNNHSNIYRSALVGVGEKPNQQPVIIVEPEAGRFPKDATAQRKLRDELLALGQANPLTQSIETVLFHPSLPVDIRHNVKIFREKLAPWAETQLQ